VFDDLSVLVEAEDVDARIILVGPGLVAVQDDVVAFREGAFAGDVLAGRRCSQRRSPAGRSTCSRSTG
jgi:hypothetical protein